MSELDESQHNVPDHGLPTGQGPTTRVPTILLIDNDPEFVFELATVLEDAGYGILQTSTAMAARALLRTAALPDLIVLDLILPDEDGLFLCGALKVAANVPILVCTASRRTHDRFLSLRLGASGYFAKPVDARTLLRRIAAALQSQPGVGSTVLHLDGLLMSRTAGQVTIGNRTVRLTPIETRLLWALATQPGELNSRDQLASASGGPPLPGGGRGVDAHIARVRIKLAQAGVAKLQIVSVRGRGYKLTLGHAVSAAASTTSAPLDDPTFVAKR